MPRIRTSELWPTKMEHMNLTTQPWGRPLDYHFKKDRKSTRLNSSHANISYAVFCLKKKYFPSRQSRPCLQTSHLVVARLSQNHRSVHGFTRHFEISIFRLNQMTYQLGLYTQWRIRA